LSKDAGIERVFLFGPAHHKYLPGCGLTYVDEYNTPMGPIPIDIDGKFVRINLVVDELKK
jgi:AmmeMemoRadiSam system protein B